MIVKLKDYYNGLNKKDIALIFVIALVVRMIALYLFGLSNRIGPDCVDYDTYAINLIKDHYYHLGDLRTFRAPLYPFFLAVIYFIFGHSFAAAKIIQVFIGSLTCVLTYLIGLEIAGRKAANISGFLACIYFALFDNSAYISTETLFTFLFAVSVLLLLRSDDHVSLSFISGMATALSALTRPTTLIFPAFAAIWFFIKAEFSKGFILLLLFCAGFTIVLTPWALRNYKIHHAFVPVNILSGNVFWASNNPWAQGRECQVKLDYAKYSNLQELERDKSYFAEGVKWLKSQSLPQLGKHYFLKLSSFFYPFLPELKTEFKLNAIFTSLNRGKLPDFINEYDPTFGFVIPFWIIGMYLVIKSGNKQGFLLLAIILVFLISSLIYYGGETRFRTAYSPYVIIFASIGLLSILQKPFGSIAVVLWGLLNICIFFLNCYFYALMQIILVRIRGS